MSKFLLTSSLAIMGFTLVGPAHAADVETKLIFNSDTGVADSISQNPKVVAESATAATKPVLKPSIESGAQMGAKAGVQVGSQVETKTQPPKPVLKSSLAETVPDAEDVMKDDFAAEAKGEILPENASVEGDVVIEEDGDVTYIEESEYNSETKAKSSTEAQADAKVNVIEKPATTGVVVETIDNTQNTGVSLGADTSTILKVE